MLAKEIVKSVLGIRRPAAESATKLPKVDLAEIFPEFEGGLKMLEPVTANGNVTIHELFTLNYAVVACAPKTIFEIGTFDGRTTLNMAANSSSSTRLYTLDLPASGLTSTQFALEEYDKSYIDKPFSGARFQNHPEGHKITQLLGDSAKFDYSLYFNTIDFVFVDGSHAYEYAKNDSLVALKLLRNRKGTIFWHDYGNICWPGVARALDEFSAKDPVFKNLKHIKDTTIACLRLE